MPIDQKLIQKNQQRLQQEKKHLEEMLNRVAKKDKNVAGEFRAKYPDFGSQEDENASEVEAYEANIAEEWDLEQKLRRVVSALARIGVGTYGVCQVGGEAMPPERLAAIPEAENCIEHESKK